MKNALLYSIILFMAVLLWGCPYSSQVPLNDAVEKLDTNLLGKWVVEAMMTNEHPEYYIISKRDSSHYDVYHHQYSDEQKEYSTKNYVGHTTRIDAILFMNLQETNGTGDYLMHRLDVVPGRSMTMYEVTDNIDEKFDDPKEMREFFRKYMKLSFFYNKDEKVLIRKKG